jgi:hypothetical protein
VAVPVASPAVLSGARRHPWWWWLLWALAALLLLLALLFVLRACREEVPVVPIPPAPIEATKPPATQDLKPMQELRIPPGALEAGDLSFLEGLWQLGDGRLNEYKQRPENVVATNRTVFEFARDGSGRAFAVERRDAKSGQALASLSARLRVHTDGKRLHIEAENGSKHECELARGGRTHCYIVNTDGLRWNAPLRRLR